MNKKAAIQISKLIGLLVLMVGINYLQIYGVVSPVVKIIRHFIAS